MEAEVIEVHVHLRLRKGEDDDLIQFFQAAGERRRALQLKQALRTGNLQAAVLDNGAEDAALADSVDEFLR